MHRHVSLDFSDLQSQEDYEANDAYSKSKLANILFTIELAERLKSANITVNTLTPGVVKTKMLEEYMGSKDTFGATPEQGAQTSIYLATSPDVADVTGKYFNNKRMSDTSREAQNRETAKKLWEVSERLSELNQETKSQKIGVTGS